MIINANALFKQLRRAGSKITYIRLCDVLQGIPLSCSMEEATLINKVLKDQLTVVKNNITNAKQEKQ